MNVKSISEHKDHFPFPEHPSKEPINKETTDPSGILQFSSFSHMAIPVFDLTWISYAFPITKVDLRSIGRYVDPTQIGIYRPPIA